MDPWLPYIYKYNKDWFNSKSKISIIPNNKLNEIVYYENSSNIGRSSEDWPPREYPKQS